jgi:hypothetical protein
MTEYIIIPRSGIVRTQVEELVTRQNITIHTESVHMVSNLNYTIDPYEYKVNVYDH